MRNQGETEALQRLFRAASLTPIKHNANSSLWKSNCTDLELHLQIHLVEGALFCILSDF